MVAMAQLGIQADDLEFTGFHQSRPVFKIPLCQNNPVLLPSVALPNSIPASFPHSVRSDTAPPLIPPESIINTSRGRYITYTDSAASLTSSLWKCVYPSYETCPSHTIPSSWVPAGLDQSLPKNSPPRDIAFSSLKPGTGSAEEPVLGSVGAQRLILAVAGFTATTRATLRGISQSLWVSRHVYLLLLRVSSMGLMVGMEMIVTESVLTILPPGPLSAEEADALRASLGAAVASSKLPHPSPPPTTSLASALFSSNSALFSTSSDQSLAKALARSLEIPLGLMLEKASLKWAGWETTTSYAGSDAAPDGGYQSLVTKVLESSKAEVKLNSPIISIKETSSGVEVTTQSGETYSATSVLSTIPLGVLKTLPENFFTPALPAHLRETIAGTHVGVLEKLLVQYPTAWWPNAEKVGSYTFLPTGPEPSASSTLEQVFEGCTLITANFAAPTLPGPTPTLLTYLSETPAKILLQHPAEKVAEAFHSFLVKRFSPASPPPAPSASALTTWLTDPLSRGATTTPSIISTGERSPMDFKELSRPVWGGKLGFAGEHTEMENRGSVAGAVLSGLREADRIDKWLAVRKQ